MEYELARKGTVRRLTEHFGLRMQKKWGQNFLIRPEVVEDIVDAAELGPDDRVLEIGHGGGIGSETAGGFGGNACGVSECANCPGRYFENGRARADGG